MNAEILIKLEIGELSFEQSGYLLKWPSGLLHELDPGFNALGNEQETVEELSLGDFNYRQVKAPLGNREVRAPVALPDFKHFQANVAGTRIHKPPEQRYDTPVRPNLLISFDLAQGCVQDNPVIVELSLEHLFSDTVIEPDLIAEGVQQGWWTVLNWITQLGLGCELLSQEQVRVLKLQASVEMAIAYLNAESKDHRILLETILKTEYAPLKRDCEQILQEIIFNKEQWKAYGAIPVLEPGGEVKRELSLLNLAVAVTAITALFDRYSWITSYLQGCHEAIGLFESLKN